MPNQCETWDGTGAPLRVPDLRVDAAHRKAGDDVPIVRWRVSVRVEGQNGSMGVSQVREGLAGADAPCLRAQLRP